MRKGFIFNHNKCVNCNACRAACILENGWTIHPRNIFTYNPEAEKLLPLINLSLACNHCESAACMNGCPSAAYRRDQFTGAIILDETKCIGCKYCQWNCPYDAPRYDSLNKTITKCHLCYSGLMEGRQPACSTACPTGALSFGQLTHQDFENIYSWFPDKKLNPAIEFTANFNTGHLNIIPESSYGMQDPKADREEKSISSEFSLIIFTYLATLSVSSVISSVVKGVFPERITFIICLLLTALVSFFHLGRKLRSWRAVTNLRYSPLSREITVFILYSFISVLMVLLSSPALLAASGITGLILLLIIDSVYIYADKRRPAILQSGQTFLSALLIASFISGIILPFVFIATTKLILSVYSLSGRKSKSIYFGIRFMRMVFLIIPGVSLILNNSDNDLITVLILLLGELFDRILFYIDFNPVNINNLVTLQLKNKRNEKERG
jgi:Fe-S-cluster-containing dehydrogenase component/DMSO reductase anchor subunit